MFVLFPKPRNNKNRATVDLPHDAHLMTSFLQVGLVDANCVNPKESTSRRSAQRMKSVMEAMRYP